MSVENALAFVKLAEQDHALRLEIGALKGRNAIEGLAALGLVRGLVFSADDYRNAVAVMAAGELDESALRKVLEEVGLAKGNPYQPRA